MIDKRLLKGIDKRLLKDVLTIKKVADKNDYGDEVYSEPLTIKNVRFDRLVGGSGNRNSKTGTGNSKSRQKQGVIYLYPSLSFVTVDNSWMGAKVNDGIGDYTINGFQTNYYDGEIFSQEIEVI
ncbi:minor capsid protein 2 [Streptococcus pneumoniae]|uniref:putative minor capsid protein n=1 Tax=Streptococcus pneumoniae TaxID=1313 RepID=UPI0000DB3CCD|nr:putative minor capsid protein [Streptococcus pneumoniae]AAZ82451.1 putative minor capsid protein [Streptococcus phage MM1 1998]MDS8392948.1 putative minor capsid protein [Streptococcus pneumoniae]TVW16061.1 capsid protein [Streptococcus pneumoniae]CEO71925.1 minor capsid protein 2 [Streptococcus pneumoniae]CEX18667.1 minor capsid protein 2 [Streptococcus pneumoniae]